MLPPCQATRSPDHSVSAQTHRTHDRLVSRERIDCYWNDLAGTIAAPIPSDLPDTLTISVPVSFGAH